MLNSCLTSKNKRVFCLFTHFKTPHYIIVAWSKSFELDKVLRGNQWYPGWYQRLHLMPPFSVSQLSFQSTAIWFFAHCSSKTNFFRTLIYYLLFSLIDISRAYSIWPLVTTGNLAYVLYWISTFDLIFWSPLLRYGPFLPIYFIITHMLHIL